MMDERGLYSEWGSKGGPTAPKDPVERRSGFYVMLESQIEATPRNEGKPSQEIYLEGEQIKNKARLAGGVTDDNILKLLENCEGFHTLVHSIGVSIKSVQDPAGNINFVLQNWGKVNKYEAGTMLRIPCPKDGSEVVLNLEDYEWSLEDDVLGKIAFEFDQAGKMAIASIKFYLNDGYHVPDIELEPPVAFGSADYQAMISKSLVSKGNSLRLKAAIERAERGEEVTIAYIGGSITQGAGAKPIHTGCYAYKSYLKFKEMFGQGEGDHIHFIKAGVGGTPSELGMIRYDRDVLKDGVVQPDIVVVEFAVNDEGDETKGTCYESLVLKILSCENKPAVILLFSVFVNDWNLQDRLSAVGRNYDLPMVSVKDAVVEQFGLTKTAGNLISKRQFFYDIYHPTNEGHTVMADCLAYLFAESKRNPWNQGDISIHKPPMFGNDFVDVQLLDRSNDQGIARISAGGFIEIDRDLQCVELDDRPEPTPQFPHNWMHTVSSGQESFKMTILSRSLILVYKDSGNGEFGSAEVFVDGLLVKTANPHENNWTHCNPIILYRGEICREHDVEIRMAPGYENKSFTILGFGYTI